MQKLFRMAFVPMKSSSTLRSSNRQQIRRLLSPFSALRVLLKVTHYPMQLNHFHAKGDCTVNFLDCVVWQFPMQNLGKADKQTFTHKITTIGNCISIPGEIPTLLSCQALLNLSEVTTLGFLFFTNKARAFLAGTQCIRPARVGRWDSNAVSGLGSSYQLVKGRCLLRLQGLLLSSPIHHAQIRKQCRCHLIDVHCLSGALNSPVAEVSDPNPRLYSRPCVVFLFCPILSFFPLLPFSPHEFRAETTGVFCLWMAKRTSEQACLPKSRKNVNWVHSKTIDCAQNSFLWNNFVRHEILRKRCIFYWISVTLQCLFPECETNSGLQMMPSRPCGVFPLLGDQVPGLVLCPIATGSHVWDCPNLEEIQIRFPGIVFQNSLSFITVEGTNFTKSVSVFWMETKPNSSWKASTIFEIFKKQWNKWECTIDNGLSRFNWYELASPYRCSSGECQ